MIFYVWTVYVCALVCGTLVYSANVRGEVKPGDVVVKVGGSIRINCSLPAGSGYNSSRLYFKLRSPTGLPDAPDRTRIVDDRTVEFRVEKAGLEYDNVHAHCYLRPETAGASSTYLASSSIHVGEPPPPIRDFRCESPNWESMVCTWDCRREPGHAGVGSHYTSYQLNYTQHAYKLDKSSEESLTYNMTCPVLNWTDPSRCNCTFPRDVFSMTVYGLYVRMCNETSCKSLLTEVDTAHIVKPNPVSDLAVDGVGATWITVKWANPASLEHTIRKLTYQLRVSYNYGTPKVFNRSDCSDCDRNARQCECVHKLTDLMPYTNYTLSVRATTQDYPAYWSAWQVIGVATNQSVPVRSPETSPGGFIADISDDTSPVSGSPFRDINLYFKDVPHEYLHGSLEDIRVEVHDSDSADNRSFSCKSTMRDRYCKVGRLDCARDYQIHLVPKTKPGFMKARPTSVFWLPPCERGPPRVHFFGEIYDSNSTSTSITFTWKPLEEPANLTLYYCASTTCEGGLEWLDVPLEAKSVNLTIDHGHRSINDYTFAMASYDDQGSPGMTSWVTCLYDYNGEPGVPELQAAVDELQSPTSVVVNIVPPECQKGSGRILMLKLHYTLDSDQDFDNNRTILLDPYVTSYRINGLAPNTDYQVSLTVVTRDGEKQLPAIAMTTSPPPALGTDIIVVIAVICAAVLLVFIFCLCRLYRHLRETPIEVKLPIDDTERQPGDVAEVEEELLNDLMCETSLQFRDVSDYDVGDETERKLLPNGFLGQPRTVKQRSRDSGNGSLLSDAHHEPVTQDPGLTMVREDVPMQFVKGPDDYVLQVHIPTAYENRHYNADIAMDGEASPLSSEPVSPGSDSLASNEASSQDSDHMVHDKPRPKTDSESDSYWQVGMKEPLSDSENNVPQVLVLDDDNGNETPVKVSEPNGRDNGYGSTTPNDASLTNCDTSDSESQCSFDSGGQSLNSNDDRTRFPSGPMVLNGDYVIRPDSLEPKRPVNSCGESSDDTDNSETGQDSYSKIGLSPEAIDNKVLGLTIDSPSRISTDGAIDSKKDKGFKVTLEPGTALV